MAHFKKEVRLRKEAHLWIFVHALSDEPGIEGPDERVVMKRRHLEEARLVGQGLQTTAKKFSL